MSGVTLITASATRFVYIIPVETLKGIGATMDLGEVLRVCRCLSQLVRHTDVQRDKEPAEILLRC